MDNQAAFAAFVAKCKEFPEQYTPEWFARREYVGGSEMYDLEKHPRVLAAKKVCTMIACDDDARAKSACAKMNSTRGIEIIDGAGTCRDAGAHRDTGAHRDAKIDSTSDLVIIDAPNASSRIADQKTQFDPAIAMGWGTLFEPILCQYIAARLDTNIECRAASYFCEPWRFSPDGVFCDRAKQYALLEMKNPFTRVWRNFSAAKNDMFSAPEELADAPDEVPAHYIPQLQMGMHLMPFLSYAFYVEGIYRRARLNGTPCALGMQRMRDVRDAPPLSSGVIGFYHPSGAGSRRLAHDFSNAANDNLLCHVITHLRGMSDGAVFVPQSAANIKTLPRRCDDIPLFGYMPWVLLAIHAVKVQRDSAFMTPMREQSARFVSSFVRECASLETRAQKIEAMHQLSHDAALAGNPEAIDIEKIMEPIVRASCAMTQPTKNADQDQQSTC